MTRGYKSLLYDEKNVQAQSSYDNNYLQGEQRVFGRALDRIYGEGTAEELEVKKWETKNWKDYELLELRAEIKRGIKYIKKLWQEEEEKNLINCRKDIYMMEYDFILFVTDA